MSYPQQPGGGYQQQPGYGTGGYAPPAGAYQPPPPGQYPPGQYTPGQYPPAGGAYQQQPQTVYIYDDRGRRQAQADKEAAEDCCLLAACCAILCCCFGANT